MVEGRSPGGSGRPGVVVIGPQGLGSALAKRIPQWKVNGVYATPSDLYDAMDAGTVDEGTEGVILIDALLEGGGMDPDGETAESLIGQMGADASIVILSTGAVDQEDADKRIRREAESLDPLERHWAWASANEPYSSIKRALTSLVDDGDENAGALLEAMDAPAETGPTNSSAEDPSGASAGPLRAIRQEESATVLRVQGSAADERVIAVARAMRPTGWENTETSVAVLDVDTPAASAPITGPGLYESNGGGNGIEERLEAAQDARDGYDVFYADAGGVGGDAERVVVEAAEALQEYYPVVVVASKAPVFVGGAVQ